MATLAITSAEVLQDGIVLRLTHGVLPDVSGGGGVPDWRPGYAEGLSVTLDGVTCEFGGVQSVTHNAGGMGLENTANAASTIPAGLYYFRVAYYTGSTLTYLSAISGRLDSGSAGSPWTVNAGQQVVFRLPFAVPVGMTARLYATEAGGLFEDMYEIHRDIAAGVEAVTLAAFPHNAGEPVPTMRQWVSWWLLPSANRVAYGETGLTVSHQASILRDHAGNATGAASSYAVTNNSIVDADGWCTADFPLSANGKVVYVSSTHGSDSNAGTSISAPKATVNSALATLPLNSGSRIKLLRGDTFPMTGNFTSRRGVAGAGQPPLMMEDYWNDDYGADPGTRPIVTGEDLSGDTFAQWPLTAGEASQFGTILHRRIHYKRCRFGSTTWGTLLACCDCILDNTGFYPDGGSARPTEAAALIRCTLHDTRFPSGKTGLGNSGVHTHYTRRLLISESTIYQCGINGGAKSIYNHDIYSQSWTNEAVIWGSWIGRASSHGWQVRGGGALAYVVSWRNCEGGFIGGRGGSLRRCVNLLGEDLDASGRGMGFMVQAGSAGVPQSHLIEECIAANTLGSQAYGFQVDCSNDGARSRAPAHVIVRNVTAFKTGRAFRFYGDRPSGSLTVEKNIFVGDPTDTSERVAVFVDLPQHDANDIADWSDINRNVYAMPQSSVDPFSRKIASGTTATLTFAEWQGEGHDADSIDRGATQPPFVDDDYDIAAYASGVAGLANEDALVEYFKARPIGTFPAWADIRASAWPAFAGAYTPTDLAAVTGGEVPFDYYGAADYLDPYTPPDPGDPEPEPEPEPEPTPETGRRRYVYIVVEENA